VLQSSGFFGFSSRCVVVPPFDGILNEFRGAWEAMYLNLHRQERGERQKRATASKGKRFLVQLIGTIKKGGYMHCTCPNCFALAGEDLISMAFDGRMVHYKFCGVRSCGKSKSSSAHPTCNHSQ